MELVSVIVPVYNADMFLDKCIKSLVNQSYDELEIILINDGSTDKSMFICENWVKLDNRIKFISKSNSGVSSTRNIGIEISMGKFIVFVDSDDFLEENAIEIMINKMHDNDMVICNCKIIELSKNTISKSFYLPNQYIFKNNEDKFNYLNRIFLVYGNGYEVWNKMYKKDIIEKYKIKFNNDICFGEDLEFNFRYLYFCNKLRIIPEVLYNYVIHDNSLVDKARDVNNFPNFNIISKYLYDFCKENDIYYFLESYYIINLNILYSCIDSLMRSDSLKYQTCYLDIRDKTFFKENLVLLLKHFNKSIRFIGFKRYIQVVFMYNNKLDLLKFLLKLKKRFYLHNINDEFTNK